MFVAILVFLLTACGKPTQVVNTPINVVKEPEALMFTIIDIRKTTDCEDQTLMERSDKFRMTRCGYFGKVGDQFYYVEK